MTGRFEYRGDDPAKIAETFGNARNMLDDSLDPATTSSFPIQIGDTVLGDTNIGFTVVGRIWGDSGANMLIIIL